jgi:hypothetical protein
MVKGLSTEWGRTLYTRSVMSSIGQAVYKVRRRWQGREGVAQQHTWQQQQQSPNHPRHSHHTSRHAAHHRTVTRS